ncbi:MAG: hypothetical protein ACJA1R_002158 [Flavobacteriales bacterium]
MIAVARISLTLASASVAVLTMGCGDAGGDPGTVIAMPCVIDPTHYAEAVVSFEPGDGAGYGTDDLPGVVTGPPAATPEGVGSLDVLSLGSGGAITLAFAVPIVDGPGVDFIVYENAFAIADSDDVFAELGAVGVSEDGVAFTWFSCDTDTTIGCAGKSPTLPHEPCALDELSLAATGGDGFDLSSVGLDEVRFVRVEDVSLSGASPSAGFDLDSVGVVNRSTSR